jgi:hypothetical protein
MTRNDTISSLLAQALQTNQLVTEFLSALGRVKSGDTHMRYSQSLKKVYTESEWSEIPSHLSEGDVLERRIQQFRNRTIMYNRFVEKTLGEIQGRMKMQ